MSLSEMKKEIVICLGSSCFSRGNKKLVQLIKQYLDEHLLNERVRFRGAHCFNMCDKGPSMKIDGREYNQLDEESVLKVLDEAFSSNED